MRFEARPGDCGWAEPGGSCLKGADGSVQTNADVEHHPWNSIDRENTTRWYSQDFYLPPGERYRPEWELFLTEWHHAWCDASIETHYGYSDDKKSYELIFLNHGRAPWTDCCNVDQSKGYEKRVTVPTGEFRTLNPPPRPGVFLRQSCRRRPGKPNPRKQEKKSNPRRRPGRQSPLLGWQKRKPPLWRPQSNRPDLRNRQVTTSPWSRSMTVKSP